MADAPGDTTDVGAYCRDVEAYLCRRNGGHIIRLVGPAFTLVSAWATQGMPLRVVLQGVDRTVTRLEARGPRRRPVRIEFCEADVLEVFDQWRRAVGPSVSRAAGTVCPEAPAKRQPSLTRHVERVVERLSSVRAGTSLPVEAAHAIDAALVGLGDVVSRAKGVRGDARQALRAELVRVDEALMASLAAAFMDGPSGGRRDVLLARAEADLRPLRPRLSDEAYRDATQRVLRHLVRVDLGLPEIVLP
jgi:hypothetical protein